MRGRMTARPRAWLNEGMRRCDMCDAPLRQLNPEAVCGPCQEAKRGRTQRLDRLQVPAEILIQPDVVASLGDGQWATVLRKFMWADNKVTQSQIGTATKLSQSLISRLMNGQVQTLSTEHCKQLCDGLGIPRDLAGLAPKGESLHVQADAKPSDTYSDAAGLSGVSAEGLTLGAFAELPNLTINDDPEAEVRLLQDTAPKLLALNDKMGGIDGLCQIAAGLVDRADRLLQQRQLPSDLINDTQSLAEEFAMDTGWLYYDGGNQRKAQAYWRHALLQAQLSGDRRMEVYALESLSGQAASFLDRPFDAIRLAQLARGIANEWAAPRLKSLLYMRESIGWATRGDAKECERTFLSAQTCLAETPAYSDPEWVNFYTKAELEGLRAYSLMLLGEDARAQAGLLNTVSNIGPQYLRNQLYYTAMLSRVTANTGDIAGASELLVPHLDAYAATGSSRAYGHLLTVIDKARRSRSSRALAFADAARDVKIWN